MLNPRERVSARLVAGPAPRVKRRALHPLFQESLERPASIHEAANMVSDRYQMLVQVMVMVRDRSTLV